MNDSTDSGTHPECPHPLRVIPQNVPAELKQIPQWVTWKYESKEENWTKRPYQVTGVAYASSTNPATWGKFEDALDSYHKGRVDGIGFVVSANDEITGIDLDHCVDLKARTIKKWAIDIVRRMESYCEFSPSGEGVRIFVKGRLPNGIAGKKKESIEIYSAARYLTVTGQHLKSGPATIELRQEAIDQLYTQVWGEEEKPKTKAAGNGNGAWHRTDDELLDRARAARNGKKFQKLFDEGDLSDYEGDDSRADMALCDLLAFWVADEAHLDRLFRRSALMRDKWDEKHGAQTYGEMTISKAFAKQTEHYEWHGNAGSTDERNSNQQQTKEETSWPDPEELPGGLLPVPPLDERLIPEPLRPWLTDIARRMQCPLEFPTIGAVIGLASLIGRSCGMRPKKRDDWTVVPNLWGALVGRPGIMKSPALEEVLRPLRRLEVEAAKAHGDKMKQFEAEELLRDARKEVLKNKFKDALKSKKSTDDLTVELSQLNEEEPKPVRYVVNDCTVEKLGELLNQNPKGLLHFRDELIGWLKSLDREGHENDRAFYLEAWNGSGSYVYDRISRGTLRIDAACVSILGGIQPGPLGGYLRAAQAGGKGADGLMQRFQLAVYPDAPQSWTNVDEWPNTEAKNRAFEIFRKLADQETFAAFAGSQPGDNQRDAQEIPFLRFAPDAQEFFDKWRGDLERKLLSDDEHPVVEAHLSKYRSLMPSLALIFHLVESVDGKASGSVSMAAAGMAAAWCDFLDAHARRIYQSVTQHGVLAAKMLANKIKAGRLRNPFTGRDVYNNGWSGLSTPEDVRRAAEILEEASWLKFECVQTGGRPAERYWINPKLGKGKETA